LTTNNVDTEVAVIGAGPHGLATAVQLRRAGADTHVFGEPLGFWRSMPKGMRLRSNFTATNLIELNGPFSLNSYMREIGERFGHPFSLQRFIDYGLWVQRNAVPDVDERSVTGLARANGGFELELADGGRMSARRVVVACGIGAFAHIPPGFEHLPADQFSHTGEHEDLSAFAGKRVLVVGGGQSAIENAVLMAERGAEVELVARRRELTWLKSWSPIHFLGPLGRYVYAPTDVGPLWYSRLVATPRLFNLIPRERRDRIAYRAIRPAGSYFVKVRFDGIKLTTGTTVTAAESGDGALKLTLSDGSTREVDHLMFGTGYRVDVAKYGFLSPEILADLRTEGGYPLLRKGLESSVPGLHFVGAPAAVSFGPTMRFMSGSWYASSRVARAVRPGFQPSRSALAAKA
jgi:lysine/ornithine N-monooxygenase